ncbi:MAG TPA: erythromycin esterase family protein [Chitinophagaceae bacterium]|nr:erythromycin esterase family protein [Chitinophagaceae bacterium]
MKYLLFFSLFPFFAGAQSRFPYNGGFEQTRSAAFWDWTYANDPLAYAFSQEHEQVHSGKHALKIEGKNAPGVNAGAGKFWIQLPAEWLRARSRLTLRGWIYSGPNTRAGIWFSQLPALRTQEMLSDTQKIAHTWEELILEIPVVPGSNGLLLGGFLTGPGIAVFDDFRIYSEGELVVDASRGFPEATASEISWLNRVAVPLASLEDEDKKSDLDLLSKWVSDKRIVGLGTPTKGTSEAFRLYLRLLKHLAGQGFRTLALDENVAAVGKLNEYVMGGPGDGREILKNGFLPSWQNEELLQLVEWTRLYNATQRYKIRFVGLDMLSVRESFDELLEFARRHDPALDDTLRSFRTGELAELLENSVIDYTNTLPGKKQLYVESLRPIASLIEKHIADNLPVYYISIPRDTVNWIRMNASAIAQNLLLMERGIPKLRDSCLAENLLAYAGQAAEPKIILLTHNGHVAKARGFLGGWLHEKLDSEYFAIAFTTASGSYHGNLSRTTWASHELSKPYPGALEYYLQAAAPRSFLLDLGRVNCAEPDAAWICRRLDYRGIGFGHAGEQFWFNAWSPSTYNALIFVSRTSAVRPLQ